MTIEQLQAENDGLRKDLERARSELVAMRRAFLELQYLCPVNPAAIYQDWLRARIIELCPESAI